MAKPVMKDIAFGMIPVLPTDPRCYLLILHQKGHWGFPKGHADPGETPLQTAQRELLEETGLSDVQVLDLPPLLEQYQFTDPQGNSVEKTVTYYIAQISGQDPPPITIQVAELADYRWCTCAEGLDLLSFAASRRILSECERLLTVANEKAPG